MVAMMDYNISCPPNATTGPNGWSPTKRKDKEMQDIFKGLWLLLTFLWGLRNTSTICSTKPLTLTIVTSSQLSSVLSIRDKLKCLRICLQPDLLMLNYKFEDSLKVSPPIMSLHMCSACIGDLFSIKTINIHDPTMKHPLILWLQTRYKFASMSWSNYYEK